MTDALVDLERRVALLEERVTMEAGLSVGGDRELGDIAQTLRAQQYTIQALAITQSQHNEKLGQQNERLDRHEASLNTAQGKLDQIVLLLTNLIDRDERRGGE